MMAVVRVNKTGDYTVMSNTHFKERGMTLKAKGLLSLMLSLPDDWDYSVAGLVSLSKDGKDSVMNALTELEDLGYLKRTRLIDDKGRFAGYDYDIYEHPQTDEPQQENPCAENPNTDEPFTEYPPQLNTNISNTKESNTKESNTKKINNNNNNNNNTIESEFEILWKLYPRKEGKKNALAAYKRARKKGTTFEQVKDGVIAYAGVCNGRETRYIKQGSTWFNGECWNDEIGGNNNGNSQTGRNTETGATPSWGGTVL